MKIRNRFVATFPDLAATDPADVGGQTGNAQGDPGIFREPGANGLHGLADSEGGINVRP